MALILSGDTGVPASGMPVGSVIQTVNATFDNPSQLNTGSTSPVSTAITLTITPTSSTSKIIIFSNTQIKNEANGVYGAVAIYRNNTTSLGWNSWFQGVSSNNWFPVTNVSYDSPATTSATTYTVYIKASGNTISVMWGSGSTSTITAMEIKQ
jgi:hypothetical protein